MAPGVALAMAPGAASSDRLSGEASGVQKGAQKGDQKRQSAAVWRLVMSIGGVAWASGHCRISHAARALRQPAATMKAGVSR